MNTHGAGNGGKKKKKSSYKTKRSFTRNKKTRSESGETRGGYQKDFAEKKGEKRFGGHFDKDKREQNKEKRAGRKELYAERGKKENRKRDFNDTSFSKERGHFGKEKKYEQKDRKEFKKDLHDKPFKKDRQSFSKEKKYGHDDRKEFRKDFSDKPYKKDRSSFDKEKKHGEGERKGFKKDFHDRKSDAGRYKKDFRSKKEEKTTYAEKGLIRLNRYISNAGICSRREADELIASGCVSVNGKIVTELGYKVKEGDEVNYSGQRLKTEKHVYVLLNKPKDYITTSDDEKGRRTVMELVAGACKERIYPVGRLDRNTLGLLLFTNDGEMAKKLTHPKHMIQKLYHVELDKNLKHDDLVKIQEGIELEDGFIKPDEVAYAGESKREVGILIHSGRNRIVRRIFEQLGYEVIRLDRVMFAGLTKKDLPRGRWRLLTEKEVSFLKMI